MGDRGNIEIRQGYQTADGSRHEASMFLYTHWRGSEVPAILADALVKAGGRAGDQAYLTRIVFDQMVDADSGIMGFGIALGYPPDNEHPIPQVWWTGAHRDRLRIAYLDRDYTIDEFVLEYATKEEDPLD